MALMDFKHAACKFFPPGHVACIWIKKIKFVIDVNIFVENM